MKDGLQCHICNQQEAGGIVIKNKYICGKCEKEIISTSPHHLEYEDIKEKVKEILFQ